MKFLNHISGVLVVFFFCQWLLAPIDTIHAAQSAPLISAESAALIDVQSGRILYAKNGDKKMRIASLTKTMTAIVAIESGKLDDVISIPNEAVGVEGSSIYLKRGEKLTLEELLYGLMLRSGNDAAVAIANQVGGSVPGFVYMMNEKAAMIGMTHTNFNNPHGLDDSNMHYSTAADMVKLSAYALRNPVFKQIVSTKVKNISWEGEEWDRRLQNKNKMLYLYRGADGVKTGYTKLAKRCLASSATRDGRQLAVITLNAPDDWNDSMNLMDWGFEQFKSTQLVEKGEPIQTDSQIQQKDQELRVVTQAGFQYPLQQSEVGHISKKVQLTTSQMGQQMIGEHVGYLNFYLDQKLIGKVPLTLQSEKETMQKVSFNQKQTGQHPQSFWEILFHVMLGGLLDA